MRIAAICLALAAAASCLAQPPAALEGSITDATGLPVPRASIELWKAGHSLASVKTTDDGRFRIETTAPAPWELRVSAAGFATKIHHLPALEPIAVRLDPSAVSTTVDVVTTAGEVSGSAAKASIPVLELPQSISIVSREELTARAPLNVQEALRYSPGVRTEQYGFDARGDWATARGGSLAQYVNGMRSLFGSYNNVRPEPFALEQMEVVRGPASVLFGQGGFGGVMNLVTKRPLEVPRGEAMLQFGSFGRKQFGLDLTGPVPNNSKLQYRLIGVARDSGTQVNYVPDDRLLVAPSITWRPRQLTRLTLLGNFQEDKMGSSVMFFPWRGTLLPHPLGQIHPSRFIGEPGFDDYTSSARSGGYLFEHTFASRWTLRQNFNYSHSRVNYQSIYADFRTPWSNNDRSLNRILYINRPFANSPTLDTNIETRFRTGFLRHSFLTGFDFQQNAITGETASGTAPAIDVFAPVYGNYTVPRTTPFAKSRQSQRGIYAQDQIKIGESWSALLSIRQDWATAETVGNAATKLDTTATTGRIGLVYTFSNGIAPYFSYSESFLPIAGFDFYNAPYKPQRGKQWETGFKYQSAAGRLFLTGAIYDLRETNRRTPDPANARNQIQVGEVQSRGADIELRARLPLSVDLLSTYAYNLPRISKSNSTDLGKRLSSMPLHVGSLWLNKQWQVGRWGRLSAGPGIRYTGSSFDGIDVLRTPSYTLFDAMVAWETASWRLSFNSANVGDKIHMTACLARGDCFIGVRRNVVASLNYKF